MRTRVERTTVRPFGPFVGSASQKPLEFEKGKSAIAVPSLDKIPAVIDTLIAAVRNGELDEQLAQPAKSAQVRKAKGGLKTCQELFRAEALPSHKCC